MLIGTSAQGVSHPTAAAHPRQLGRLVNGSDAEPELRINAPAALALVIAASATPGTAGVGHCCLCAEGVADEYLGGGWFHSERRENGLKEAERECHEALPACKLRPPRVLIARYNRPASVPLMECRRTR